MKPPEGVNEIKYTQTNHNATTDRTHARTGKDTNTARRTEPTCILAIIGPVNTGVPRSDMRSERIFRERRGANNHFGPSFLVFVVVLEKWRPHTAV